MKKVVVLLVLSIIIVDYSFGQVMKETAKGLFQRDGMPSQLHVRSRLSGFVVNVNWADLQPNNSNEDLTANNAIDQAITQVRTLPNASHMKIKVRVFAGSRSPEWAKTLSGGSLDYLEPQGNGTIIRKVPQWWKISYQEAYEQLIQKLADKYDDVPEIIDFTISGAMTYYAEPFIRGVANADNRRTFVDAGYTQFKDIRAHKMAIDAHKAFKYTCSSLAFNPLQGIEHQGSDIYSTLPVNLTATKSIMDYAVDALCSRIVLENNSIRDDTVKWGDRPQSGGGISNYGQMYNHMLSFGVHTNITFQTATSGRVIHLENTIKMAIFKGANMIELPGKYPYHHDIPGGTVELTDAQLTQFNNQLKLNSENTNHCNYFEPTVCLWLEGAYDVTTDKMKTGLLQKGLLPTRQPFHQAPWNYKGYEGAGWSHSDYPVGSVDWVLVSIRTDPSPGSKVRETAAILLEDGCLFFPNEHRLSITQDSSFYIVVKHRNHLTAMSPTPVSLNSEVLSYDFRNADSYKSGAGAGQKQMVGQNTWMLFAGDADQSNPSGYDINGNDKIIWEVNNGLFNIYDTVDFDLDGDISGADRLIWNYNNGVFSTVPK